MLENFVLGPSNRKVGLTDEILFAILCKSKPLFSFLSESNTCDNLIKKISPLVALKMSDHFSLTIDNSCVLEQSKNAV